MTEQPRKIHMSSAGFMFGRIPVCSSSSSCLRVILLTSRGVGKTDFPQKYAILGKHNEDRLEAENLKNDSTIIEYDREHAVKIDIGSGVTLSGRIDFLCRTTGTDKERVVEAKSADSKRTLTECIKKGKPKSDNLAQLVTYMIFKNIQNGQLIYSFYEWEGVPLTPVLKAERVFAVTIDSEGKILLDGQPSGFYVSDRLDRLEVEKMVVSQGIVWDRPLNWESFSSPCLYCQFSAVCDRYDSGVINSASEFVLEAQVSTNVKEF